MFTGEENAPPNIEIQEFFNSQENQERFYSNPDENNIAKIKAFGFNDDKEFGLRFSYYIGLDYFDDDNTQPLYVAPKIKNLDYHAMFKECVESPETTPYISNIYDIRIDKPFIEPPTVAHNDFILLIMYQYQKLLAVLIKKPLIKEYINKTENLNSKIKGKILISGHIKKNIFSRRNDRVLCNFNEYSKDCLANRLLHSALRICKDYSGQYLKNAALFFEYIEPYFADVGYVVNPMELNKIKTNPLFLEYKDTLKLAKIIYRCKAYHENLQSKDKFTKIPPYIIDMSKLFELYVLAKLKRTTGLDIGYQVSGSSGIVDFLEYNKKIVIDTKYKKIYDSDNQFYKIDDIRQVSGYARDKRLLKKLYEDHESDWKTIIPPCLIIYPDMTERKSDIFPEKLLEISINQFNEFYRYGIKLPEKDG
jgi:5-methylcytosine-specific restriction enzyme subunit McrC